MKDTELKTLIENDLLYDARLSSQPINLEIENGRATLRGRVGSFRRKLAAEQIVASYQGIREVFNELSVEPVELESDSDVATRVRATLDSSADINKETITVGVLAGKVTLSGNVSSHWERIVAEDICRGVRGVRDVVNMLLVDPIHATDDCELTKEIKNALGRARGLASARIDIAIGEDTVVLSGEVQELWQKEVAQTVVGRFGLLHIRNEIRVS